jgi:hypothetical protein
MTLTNPCTYKKFHELFLEGVRVSDVLIYCYSQHMNEFLRPCRDWWLLTSRPVVSDGGSGLCHISVGGLGSNSEQVILTRGEISDGVLGHAQSRDQCAPVLQGGFLYFYLVGQGDVQIIIRGDVDSAPAKASLVGFLFPDFRPCDRDTRANYNQEVYTVCQIKPQIASTISYI